MRLLIPQHWRLFQLFCFCLTYLKQVADACAPTESICSMLGLTHSEAHNSIVRFVLQTRRILIGWRSCHHKTAQRRKSVRATAGTNFLSTIWFILPSNSVETHAYFLPSLTLTITLQQLKIANKISGILSSCLLLFFADYIWTLSTFTMYIWTLKVNLKMVKVWCYQFEKSTLPTKIQQSQQGRLEPNVRLVATKDLEN